MRHNWVRERVRDGQATIGCFLGLGSPNVAELLAHAGFDWLVIETEHSPLDTADVEHMLMAISGTETIPLVRVPSGDPLFIQRVLDMGAMGIVVPMVKTIAEAEAIVEATRFPPQGTRGFGPLRASRYTLDYDDYLKHANDNILVALILETKEAVENLEDIMAVPGIDVVYLGPFDLCLSLGLDPMQMPLAEIDAVLERALAIGYQTGVAVGTGARTPEDLRRLQAQGYAFLGYGGDYALLLDAARAGLAVFERT